ncbi:MAG: AarF/ABC1/UbiB kinase family protein [Alcanivorax sp.]|nr:AarF/ABC1/UbiB kinase family protein [Alcanivorax sp.]
MSASSGPASPARARISAPRLIWHGRGRYIRVLGTIRQLQQALWLHRDLLRSKDEDARMPLHEDVAAAVAELCRRNGGAWIKFAQFLSCRPDLLPPPYIDAFTALREDAPSAHFDDVQPWLEELLGKDWARTFSAFNIIPVASASIAQVHRAKLADGTDVAVKLQLPKVRQEFHEDAAALRALARVLAPLLREVDLRQVVNQLITTTERELDFNQEARHLEEFAALPHGPNIRVPRVFPALCSERLLVTEWMEGPSLSQILEAGDDARIRPLLETLLDSTLQQVLEFGLFHADPHPGNFIAMDDKTLAVLDLGAVEHLSQEDRQRYTLLLMALLGESSTPLLPLFEAAGFGGVDEARLTLLSEALIAARTRDATLASNLHALMDEFRRLHLRIPDPFVAMVRVLITVGGLMTRYSIPFRWPALSG